MDCYILKNGVYLLFLMVIVAQTQSEKYTYELIEQGTVPKLKTIRKGSSTVIEKFDNLGIIIDHHLSSQEDCQIRQQQLHHKKWRDILLVSNYTEQQFRENFEGGRFQSTLPELIAMYQQNNHIFIVRNDGWLIYAEVQNMRINKLCKTKIGVNNKIHIALVVNKLIIISDPEHTQIILDFKAENIFTTQEKVVLDVKLDDIIKVKTANDLIVIAQRNLGISIFQLQNDTLILVDKISSVNISDIHVIKDELYVLDTDTGLIVYKLSDKSLMMDLIRFPGQTFGVYGNSILIANYESEKTKIIDVHLDININKQIRINTYYISGRVHQIKMTSDYAIILGNLGNYIIYHSIAEYFSRLNRRKWFPEEFKFPFKHIDQIQTDDNISLFAGISKHSFMLVVSTLEPAKLRCYPTQNNFYLKYESYSTQCPMKSDINNDLQACHQMQEFQVTVVQPILTTQDKHYAYGFASVCFAALSIIIILLVRKYIQYKRITSDQFNEISSAEMELPSSTTDRPKPEMLPSPPAED